MPETTPGTLARLQPGATFVPIAGGVAIFELALLVARAKDAIPLATAVTLHVAVSALAGLNGYRAYSSTRDDRLALLFAVSTATRSSTASSS